MEKENYKLKSSTKLLIAATLCGLLSYFHFFLSAAVKTWIENYKHFANMFNTVGVIITILSIILLILAGITTIEEVEKKDKEKFLKMMKEFNR